jgi:hypothetical protein
MQITLGLSVSSLLQLVIAFEKTCHSADSCSSTRAPISMPGME